MTDRTLTEMAASISDRVSENKLKRLLEQVEARVFCRRPPLLTTGAGEGFLAGQVESETSKRIDARTWLANWLYTPLPELNGAKPVTFLPEEDGDLILVGIMIRCATATAWQVRDESQRLPCASSR